MKETGTSRWDAWIARHRRELEKNHGWELKFVETVLRHVPGLDPHHIGYQTPFVGSDGRNRRIDLTIDEGQGWRLAIEIDGFDKTGAGRGMNKREMFDFLRRQNDIGQQGWSLIRFMNGQVANDTENVRREIDLRLRALRAGVNRETVTKWDIEELRNLTLAREEEYKELLESLRQEIRTSTSRERSRAFPAGIVAVALGLVIGGAIWLSRSDRAPNVKTVESKEARTVAGDEAHVCGPVAEVTWLYRNDGAVNLTFVNFDAPHPNQTLAAVMKKPARDAFWRTFRNDPQSLEGNRVCVTGLVTLFENRVQMEIEAANEIEF